MGCGRPEPSSLREKAPSRSLLGLQYGGRQDFLWRLARAYSDMCELAEEASEKKSYAQNGEC